MTRDEYEEVKDTMENAGFKANPVSVPRKGGKREKEVKKEATEEEKKIKEMKTSRKAATTLLQKKFTLLRKECIDVLAMIPAVEVRFPREFCAFLEKGVEAVKSKADAAAEVYAREVIKPDADNVEELDKERHELTELANQIDQATKEARQGIFADIKKNVS